ncbi:MAG TPA: SpoVR family protein, partial [Candidatus Krumholzibacteria bacterium]|nr:SpoVR family protein [Candidatus Krumholzibacteria bacterium]
MLEKAHLAELIQEIEGYARGFGLDFFPVVFEMLDYEEINMVASYGGFPTRYPHWRFGMQYEYMQKSYGYGLHKIYEMVINNNPCYAYLLNSNQLVDQKLVIGHVFAHSDFFKNNAYFKNTNRHMMDELANHGIRIQDYMSEYGHETVEDFIDVCSSIENLIDPG